MKSIPSSTDVVQAANIRMCKRRYGSRFALKTSLQIRIEGKMSGKNFDGNVAPQARVPRAIHLSHSTSTNRCKDLVRAESGARDQGLRLAVDSGLCRKIERGFFEEAAGAVAFHQHLLDLVLQFRFITAGAIEKGTPGLWLHDKCIAEQFLNGLSLLAHHPSPVAIGRSVLACHPPHQPSEHLVRATMVRRLKAWDGCVDYMPGTKCSDRRRGAIAEPRRNRRSQSGIVPRLGAKSRLVRKAPHEIWGNAGRRRAQHPFSCRLAVG